MRAMTGGNRRRARYPRRISVGDGDTARERATPATKKAARLDDAEQPRGHCDDNREQEAENPFDGP